MAAVVYQPLVRVMGEPIQICAVHPKTGAMISMQELEAFKNACQLTVRKIDASKEAFHKVKRETKDKELAKKASDECMDGLSISAFWDAECAKGHICAKKQSDGAGQSDGAEQSGGALQSCGSNAVNNDGTFDSAWEIVGNQA